MQYGALVDEYDELESTSGTLEKRANLADAFIEADSADLPRLVTLVRGRVFPDWVSTELGVSSSLTTDAIVKATGVSEDRVEDWWREKGDIGDAARHAATDRPQQSLFTQELTVQRVYETLRELATYEGEGSQDRKVAAIAGLLSDAEPREARYLVRTVAGAMRLGVGEGLIPTPSRTRSSTEATRPWVPSSVPTR